MLIYFIFIFSIYFGFLLVCIFGWRKYVHRHPSSGVKTTEFVSVLVAIRNEEGSIARLLDSLKLQDFQNDNFELILVDDHSTDNTEQIIHHWIGNNPQICCSYVKSDEHGKKRALTKGVQHATGEIILTTDADCIHPPDWISRMVLSFSIDTTMAIGLVKIQQGNSIFSRLQALEFSSLMGSGVALLSLGFPVMCNGASLAFRKTGFIAVNGYEANLHIPSGDDEFLMRKLHKAFPGSVKPIKYSPEVVTTRALNSLKDFVNQRLRWAGKWKANDSWVAKGLAVFIIIFQVSFMFLIGGLFFSDYSLVAGTLLGTKFLLEGFFLFTVNRNTSQPFSWLAFLMLQLLYPIYVIVIGIFSQLLDYEWKGRKEHS